MSGAPFDEYEPADRVRISELLMIELPDITRQIKEAAPLINLEFQAGRGIGGINAGVSMLRGQADAIERVAALQQRQAALVREMATIMERNNPFSGRTGG